MALFNEEMNAVYDNQRRMGFPGMVIRSGLKAAKGFFPLLAPCTAQTWDQGLREVIRGLPLVVLQLPLFVFPCIAFSPRRPGPHAHARGLHGGAGLVDLETSPLRRARIRPGFHPHRRVDSAMGPYQMGRLADRSLRPSGWC